MLAGREAHASLAESGWLLAPLLHLLQEPSHLLGLLLMLLQELLRDIFFLVTHPQYLMQDAQHHQDLGDAPSHGLEEEKERTGSAGLGGREKAAGTVGAGDTGNWECVGEGMRELRGIKGKVGELCGDRTTSPQPLGHLPWLTAPGTFPPSSEGNTCPDQGTPWSLSPSPQPKKHPQHFWPGPRSAQPSPCLPHSLLVRASTAGRGMW